ncbi:transposase [bacterium]|nr:transposase [bacterium]
MRRARLTYKGALHHIMSRGINGEKIFFTDNLKKIFVRLLDEKSKKYKIGILAYSILDNHYHLIMENTSGNLSRFMRDLNGEFGMIYRKIVGGKGYVFQGRYKSTLIQREEYLQIGILYVLLNALKAGVVKNPFDYKWCSINEYFTGKESKIVNNRFVEKVLHDRENFIALLKTYSKIDDLPIRKTRMGEIMGNEKFEAEAYQIGDRRKLDEHNSQMRIDDNGTEDFWYLIRKFEKETGTKVDEIDIKTQTGKILRAKLIILLRDICGLKYSEINQIGPFKNLKYSYLGRLYKIAKAKV